MGPNVYAENTLMYRPIANNNPKDFTLKKNIRRPKRKHMRESNLVSSNNRSLIVMASGRQTNIAKGTYDEFRLWQVKDTTISPGNYYYFSCPDEAERVFDTKYNKCDVFDWRNRQYKFSDNADDDDNDNSFHYKTPSS
jgi:hypothetical protein